MFNGVFDDIPLGQIFFQYKVYAPKNELGLISQINKIKSDLSKNSILNKNYILGQNAHEMIGDLRYLLCYLNDRGRVEYFSTYNLNTTSTKFNTETEEEHYRYDLDIFLEIVQKLYRLHISCKFDFAFEITDAKGHKLTSMQVSKSSMDGCDLNTFLSCIMQLCTLGMNDQYKYMLYSKETNRVEAKSCDKLSQKTANVEVKNYDKLNGKQKENQLQFLQPNKEGVGKILRCDVKY